MSKSILASVKAEQFPLEWARLASGGLARMVARPGVFSSFSVDASSWECGGALGNFLQAWEWILISAGRRLPGC